MKSLKIAVAIPTYNRRENLETAVNSFLRQRVNSTIDKVCIISNVASEDSTREYLETLRQKPGFIIRNETSSTLRYLNPYAFGPLVPDDVDWVWWHGDDDFFTDDSALLNFAALINSHADKQISLVHVTQGKRSRDSGIQFLETGKNLCNRLGYIELLGWLSSLVVRRDKFVSSMNRIFSAFESVASSGDELLRNRVSSIAHSKFIFEEVASDQILFIDRPWIDEQEFTYKDSAKALWIEERTDDRWFFVVDDWHELTSRGFLSLPLQPPFFRWLAHYFWDRLGMIVVSNSLQVGSKSDLIENQLSTIQSIGTLLINASDKKFFSAWFDSLRIRLDNYFSAVSTAHREAELVVRHREYLASPTFPYHYFNIKS